MIKKKYLVILFSLLLAALLGMFSSCYAVEKGQIQNLAYNWYTNYIGWNEDTTRQFITAKDNGFDNVNDLMNSNYGIIANRSSSTEFYVFFVPYNYSEHNEQYISANSYGWYIYEIGWIRFTSSSISSLKRNSVHGGRQGKNTDVVYTDFDIYNGDNSNSSIVYSAGYNTPEWFNLIGDYYSELVWEFSPTSNSQTVTINGGNQWQYHAITGGWDIYLGSITDSEWVDKIQYRVGYWNSSLNQFSPVSSNTYTIYDYAKNGPLYKYWSSTNNGNTYTTGIYLDTYKYQNCILQLVITSEIPNELTTIYYDYLITNSKTYITGGIFYPTLTFSGDYLNDYNNQEQVNTNQENNDNLINTLTDSSYSGDITLPSIDIEDPTGDFFTWLYTSFVSVLNNNNNTYIDIPIWKTNYRIYSNVFMLPNGLLRDFISARLVAYSWFAVFKIY